jgi:hypothetical protein
MIEKPVGYSDNEYDYSDDHRPPPQQMIPERIQSSSQASHPQQDEYSDEYENDGNQEQTYKNTPRSQSRKIVSQYSVTESEYSEQQQSRKPASVRQQPVDDDEYYYSDDDPAPNSASQKSGTQKSQPLAQASLQSQRSGREDLRAVQKQSEAEYSTREYSTNQQQSSRSKLAAIRAASQKSYSSRREEELPIPSPNAVPDDEYSYYSDDSLVKNTATTGYKVNGYSYTPTQGTPSSKASAPNNGNLQEPVEDNEDPYDYDYDN